MMECSRPETDKIDEGEGQPRLEDRLNQLLSHQPLNEDPSLALVWYRKALSYLAVKRELSSASNCKDLALQCQKAADWVQSEFSLKRVISWFDVGYFSRRAKAQEVAACLLNTAKQLKECACTWEEVDNHCNEMVGEEVKLVARMLEQLPSDQEVNEKSIERLQKVPIRIGEDSDEASLRLAACLALISLTDGNPKWIEGLFSEKIINLDAFTGETAKTLYLDNRWSNWKNQNRSASAKVFNWLLEKRNIVPKVDDNFHANLADSRIQKIMYENVEKLQNGNEIEFDFGDEQTPVVVRCLQQSQLARRLEPLIKLHGRLSVEGWREQVGKTLNIVWNEVRANELSDRYYDKIVGLANLLNKNLDSLGNDQANSVLDELHVALKEGDELAHLLPNGFQFGQRSTEVVQRFPGTWEWKFFDEKERGCFVLESFGVEYNGRCFIEPKGWISAGRAPEGYDDMCNYCRSSEAGEGRDELLQELESWPRRIGTADNNNEVNAVTEFFKRLFPDNREESLKRKNWDLFDRTLKWFKSVCNAWGYQFDYPEEGMKIRAWEEKISQKGDLRNIKGDYIGEVWRPRLVKDGKEVVRAEFDVTDQKNEN